MDGLNWHGILEALHIISVISWMAAIFYLPRLYVYHADVAIGSDQDALFQVMERRLLRVIMNPAMIATWVFGLSLIHSGGWLPWQDVWLGLKLVLVLAMTIFHMFLARWRKDFAVGKNNRSAKFYRRINEVPTVLMIVIVFLVVLKPF